MVAGGVAWAIVLAMLVPGAPCKAPIRSGPSNALTIKLRLNVKAFTADGKPASGYQVRFLDTAPVESERDDGRLLGATDEQGSFAAVVKHTWADYFLPNRRPDSGTFDIVVGGEVAHGAVECLTREGDELRLSVTVKLKPNWIQVSDRSSGASKPPNKAMKLTELSPAPLPVGGAGSCPRRTISDAGTAPQLIASVRPT